MAEGKSKIIYTLTDEAPLLATCAFLPIVRSFTEPTGIEVETADISVAGRVLAEFPEYLSEEQRVPDTLAELGRLTLLPCGNGMLLVALTRHQIDIDWATWQTKTRELATLVDAL